MYFSRYYSEYAIRGVTPTTKNSGAQRPRNSPSVVFQWAHHGEPLCLSVGVDRLSVRVTSLYLSILEMGTCFYAFQIEVMQPSEMYSVANENCPLIINRGTSLQRSR